MLSLEMCGFSAWKDLSVTHTIPDKSHYSWLVLNAGSVISHNPLCPLSCEHAVWELLIRRKKAEYGIILYGERLWIHKITIKDSKITSVYNRKMNFGEH